MIAAGETKRLLLLQWSIPNSHIKTISIENVLTEVAVTEVTIISQHQH